MRRQRPSDQDDRRAVDLFGCEQAYDRADRAANNALFRPARASNHGDRTVVAADRGQLLDDLGDRLDREMNGQRRSCRGKGRELFALRQRRGARSEERRVGKECRL